MNRSISLTAAVLIGITLSACSTFRDVTNESTDYVMKGTQTLPAARGNASVMTTDDGNTQVDVKVEHLAQPAQITPDATVFILWVQNRLLGEGNAQPQNLGALRVGDDLTGKITAMTPLRDFDLYITAEPSAQVVAPSGEALLRTDIKMN